MGEANTVFNGRPARHQPSCNRDRDDQPPASVVAAQSCTLRTQRPRGRRRVCGTSLTTGPRPHPIVVPVRLHP